MGPRACLDVFGKSRPPRDSIPVPSSPYPVAIPTELPAPRKSFVMKQNRISLVLAVPDRCLITAQLIEVGYVLGSR
jgi:hypothetical protein